MGIEPTERRLSTRPTDFEDRGRHQPGMTRRGLCIYVFVGWHMSLCRLIAATAADAPDVPRVVAVR